MGWAKIDDQMHRRRKTRGLSDAAWRLYVSAIIDCCAESSDGVIEGTYLRELLPHHHEKHVRDLLTRGLLHDTPGCKSETCLGSQGMPVAGSDLFVVHDFHQWQMTAQEWEVQKAKKQKAAHARWHKDEPKAGCRFCYPSIASAHAGASADAMPTRPDLTRPDPSSYLTTEDQFGSSPALSTDRALEAVKSR